MYDEAALWVWLHPQAILAEQSARKSPPRGPRLFTEMGATGHAKRVAREVS